MRRGRTRQFSSRLKSRIRRGTLESYRSGLRGRTWLKLRAISSQGPGVLDGVTFIQRVDTVAGIAPSTPGTTVGQEADVPYMAEYYFYQPVASAEETE